MWSLRRGGVQVGSLGILVLPHLQKCPCPSSQACLMGLREQTGVYAVLPHTDLAYSSLPPVWCSGVDGLLLQQERSWTRWTTRDLQAIRRSWCWVYQVSKCLAQRRSFRRYLIILFPWDFSLPVLTYGTELLPRAHFQYKHSCLSFKNKELGPTWQNNPGKMGQVPVTFSRS